MSPAAVIPVIVDANATIAPIELVCEPQACSKSYPKRDKWVSRNVRFKNDFGVIGWNINYLRIGRNDGDSVWRLCDDLLIISYKVSRGLRLCTNLLNSRRNIGHLVGDGHP